MNLDIQIECVKKEVNRRKRKYKTLVEEGSMSQERATAEIATFQAVLETLTQLKGILKGS